MRLDARAFGTAAGMVAAALFTICALAVAVAPEGTTALASYLIHMDLSGMTRTMTFGGFIGGLVIWTLGTGVTFGAVAEIYNLLVARSAATQRAAAARPAPQVAQF
jgi:2TM family of unknown function (DUF5676)